jgi:hypothetical protein
MAEAEFARLNMPEADRLAAVEAVIASRTLPPSSAWPAVVTVRSQVVLLKASLAVALGFATIYTYLADRHRVLTSGRLMLPNLVVGVACGALLSRRWRLRLSHGAIEVRSLFKLQTLKSADIVGAYTTCYGSGSWQTTIGMADDRLIALNAATVSRRQKRHGHPTHPQLAAWFEAHGIENTVTL